MKLKIWHFAGKIRKKVMTRIETSKTASILKDTRGEQNTSTSGLVILAIVAIGLAVVWINAKAPGFFTSIGDKINNLFNLK